MTIELCEKHVKKINEGRARVSPGNPFHLNEAASVGDGVWQGDLGIEIVEKIPDGYVPSKRTRQLVPGDTLGARHCLDDPSTVDQFSLPEGWGKDYTGLDGPSFVCILETTISHPVHGDVIVSKGHVVRCRYQRNLDEETKREQRAVD